MTQFFSRPDAYIGLCGDLRCALVERRVAPVPAFMRGLRALFMADVHALPRTTEGQMDALADKIMAAAPDLILLGGDYSDTAEPCRRLFERLARVSAPLGKFAVAGNNDREAFPDLDVLRRATSRAGFELLVNEARKVRVNGGRLIVAGLDEYRYGRPDAWGLYPDAPNPNRYRLLLSHYPCPVAPMPDLMLCGHTHGGQFNLLGLTPYAIGYERVFRRRGVPRFIDGLHPCGGGQVFTSKGIGASTLPLRIGVRPEIELLTFE